MLGASFSVEPLISYFFCHRHSTESVMTKILTKASMKRKDMETMWSWSKDTLKKPLLKRTYNREDVKKLAIHSFNYILFSNRSSSLHNSKSKRFWKLKFNSVITLEREVGNIINSMVVFQAE